LGNLGLAYTVLENLRNSGTSEWWTFGIAVQNCARVLFQLIIDECGMSKEAESLVAIISSRARHVVLVGDHRQLEPVILDNNAANLGLSRSLFERYAEQAIMLTTQYRMVR